MANFNFEQFIKERPNLEKNENEYWDKINKIEVENLSLEEETTFAKQNFLNYKSELERLSKLSMLNEVFDIIVHEDMPTITKLHLGKNPNTGVVNWDETSAGLGHICLLLSYIRLKNDVNLGNVKIQPLGSQSKIVVLQAKGGTPVVCKLNTPNEDVSSNLIWNLKVNFNFLTFSRDKDSILGCSKLPKQCKFWLSNSKRRSWTSSPLRDGPLLPRSPDRYQESSLGLTSRIPTWNCPTGSRTGF